MVVLVFAILVGLAALGFAALRARDVLAEDDGNDTMRGIAASIQEGAAAFLKREYTFIGVFVAGVFFVLIIFVDYDVLDKFGRSPDLPETAISYLFGAILSATAGYAGMTIAVRANVRTAASAQRGLNPALRTAFNSGTVMGMTVVGLGLIGVTLLYIIWESVIPLTGFAFGASSIALFARVGGGIFTKAADVGADLVGKVEAGIPEDDPRNPATIADNVGDNVGDVAGMGADLFESYVGSIVATIALGALAFGSTAIGAAAVFDAGSVTDFDSDPFILPILVAAIGIISAVNRYLPGAHRRRSGTGPAALGPPRRRLWRQRLGAPGIRHRHRCDGPGRQPLLGDSRRPHRRPDHWHHHRGLHLH